MILCSHASIYQKFTLDVIADVAFGITLDAQNKTEGRFLKECRQAFKGMETRGRLIKLAGEEHIIIDCHILPLDICSYN